MGTTAIPNMPIVMTKASLGYLTIIPCISSTSLLPVEFSYAPTDMNIMDLVTAWNIRSIMPAHTASGMPQPAAAVISPRLDMVEYARTFFPSDTVIARSDAAKNVNPPIAETMTPTYVPCIIGDSLSSRYTPALTIVAECKSAEVGVGATIAPSSQPEKGSCADLVSAAKASIAAGNIAMAGSAAKSRSCDILVISMIPTQNMMAAMNPHPPRRFIQSALKEFVTASPV